MPNAFKKALNWFRKPKKSYKEIAQTSNDNDKLDSSSSSCSDDSLVEINEEEKKKIHKSSLFKQEIKIDQNPDKLISMLLPKINNLSFIRLSDYSKPDESGLLKKQTYLNPVKHKKQDFIHLEHMLEQYYENNQEKVELLGNRIKTINDNNFKKVNVKRLSIGNSLQ